MGARQQYPVAPGFHRRLAAWRLFRKMEQEALEDLVGAPRTSVSRWERPDGPVPRRPTIRRIAQALGCDEEDLVNNAPLPGAVPAGQKVVAYRNGYTGKIAV